MPPGKKSYFAASAKRMIFTVIVVNYNVRELLEQCLSSIADAAKALPAGEVETLVYDNASTDGSVAALAPLFPQVRFIAGAENLGFSRANNAALAGARGEYILFLNPDTILPEDVFPVCLDFFRGHPRAGALGVRMIDGRGNFLPESKRGFPDAAASFFKLSGLIRLFPRSRRVAAYYLGHLDPDGTHAIDVVSGAFFLVPRAVLDRTGAFDERFFMYAEDIDLSYRIQKAGYVNYYLPAVTIVHFKGESTAKDRDYIRQFYRAMDQFVLKYRDRHPGAALPLMRAAIRFREKLAAWPLRWQKSRPDRPGTAPLPRTAKNFSWKQIIANIARQKTGGHEPE